MNIKNKKTASLVAGGILVASMMIIPSVFADNESRGEGNPQRGANWNMSSSTKEYRNGNGLQQGIKPVVVGKVLSINGDILTVLGRQNEEDGSGTSTKVEVTYAVNISNATIIHKDRATSTVSSISIGDMIMVQGTITGTTINATFIRNNTPFGKNAELKNSSSTIPNFVGNGQPVVIGKITIINGNTITIATANNIVYTVDATTAKVLKGKDTITISGIKVGDTILVQGAVNGSSIIASTIVDKVDAVSKIEKSGGLFGGIGRFFMRLFGF